QLALGDDLGGGAVERRAADCDRARTEGAGALRHVGGVALDDVDALDRNAEARGDDLREGGGVALAVIVGAERDTDRAIGTDADRGRLVEADAGAERAGEARGRDAGGLDVAGHADAAQPATARRFGAARGKAGVIGDLQHPREYLREVAAVVGGA